MSSVDVNFFKPFIFGALNTLKVQCNVEAKSSKPFRKGSQEQKPIGIAGVISLNSSSANGSIALCFPTEVFLFVMGKMFGETYTEINKDLEDGVGEILNITFGQAKRALTDQGIQMEKAIPVIVRGDNLQMSQFKSKEIPIVLPFDTEAGTFYMEVYLN